MPNDEQSGFMAISPPIPPAPHAIRKMVRGEDGRMKTILVDPATGQELPNANGYNIVENGNYLDPNALAQISPLASPGEQEAPTTSQQIIQDTRGGGDRGTELSDPRDSVRSRGVDNDFGYINKPGLLGFASALPGPLGLAGKAVNAGINMNNVAAVNDARSMMGVPELSGWEATKGAFKDRQGQVADVNIGKNTYSVGFEAMSPKGQTNLTPSEAARRGQAFGIDLATKEETRANTAQYAAENPKAAKRTGILSKTFGFAKDFVDSIFGNKPNNLNSFPSRPDAPKSGSGGSLSSSPYGGSSGRAADGSSLGGRGRGGFSASSAPSKSGGNKSSGGGGIGSDHGSSKGGGSSGSSSGGSKSDKGSSGGGGIGHA